MNNVELGKIGEDAATDILVASGYKILRRNFRCREGEVDIIASRGPMICFVEVKTRRSMAYGRPCEAVDMTKQKHIRRAAYCYLKEMESKGYVPAKVSFDVMEVMVQHIKGAF